MKVGSHPSIDFTPSNFNPSSEWIIGADNPDGLNVPVILYSTLFVIVFNRKPVLDTTLKWFECTMALLLRGIV